jgi:NTE family protein
VLDRLLEEEWLEVEGISGTSAGAMNAAVLASAFARGGAPAAREALAVFWKRVSVAATFSPIQRGPVDRLLGNWTLDNSPGFLVVELLARLISPYDVPSFGGNPLEQILRESVDFGALAEGPIKVFITATNVRTGRARIFRKGTSRRRRCSPPPACRSSSRRSRSTASPTGTAASPATRRWCP